MKMCGLAEILNQILIYIYDPVRESTESEFYNCFEEQAKNLSDWWDELPSNLKLVATEPPPYCPPSHIALLKYVPEERIRVRMTLHQGLLLTCIWFSVVYTTPLTSYCTDRFSVPPRQNRRRTTRVI